MDCWQSPKIGYIIQLSTILQMFAIAIMKSLNVQRACNVNPGLINPKRLFTWEGTI